MTENKFERAGLSAPGREVRPFWSPNERLRIAIDTAETPPRGDGRLETAAGLAARFRPLNGNLRIAVDFDGVLFNHVPHMLRAFRDNHNVNLLDEGLRHWDFMQYRCVQKAGLTFQGIKTLLHAVETDLHVHDTDLRDEAARQVMRAWREAGHQVFIVTARDWTSEEATRYFLERNAVPYDGLMMDAKVKSGYDLLVDDAPHNIQAAVAAGGMAFLMDHPYNRGVRTGMNPRRVRTWSEVGGKFHALSRAPIERALAARNAALAVPTAVTSKVGAAFGSGQ